MKHPSFRLLVESKWNSYNVSGWGSFVLKEKLKRLKADLKGWRHNTFGDLDKSIKDKKAEIERLDILDDSFGQDEEERR